MTGQLRTTGRSQVADHLRPKPRRFLQHLDCCQRYVRLARPGEICWRVDFIELDEGEA
jgi:hypothetical protein